MAFEAIQPRNASQLLCSSLLADFRTCSASMLYRAEHREDGSVQLWPPPKDDGNHSESAHSVSRNFIVDIDEYIEDHTDLLWGLNKFIHDNPELAFEERKAHDALTAFMAAEDDWEVTRSAYGLETAWIAVYDSGKAGPVVSFNAEMGPPHPHSQTSIAQVD